MHSAIKLVSQEKGKEATFFTPLHPRRFQHNAIERLRASSRIVFQKRKLKFRRNNFGCGSNRGDGGDHTDRPLDHARNTKICQSIGQSLRLLLGQNEWSGLDVQNEPVAHFLRLNLRGDRIRNL